MTVQTLNSLHSDLKPAVSQMFRLQFEPAQDSWVLLYPEGLVRLNPAASEILRRCDGVRSIDQIVEELEQAFQSTAVRGDVLKFMTTAYANGWLV